MKTIWQFLLAFNLLAPMAAHSATVTNLEVPGVNFRIAISNSVIKAGSTIELDCSITSTNYSVLIHGWPHLGVGLVLTNSAGKAFILATAETLFNSDGSQPGYRAEKDRPCEWQLALVIPQSIPTDNYTLVASKFVWILQAPSVPYGSHNPYGMLVSNSLKLRLTP